MEMDELKFSKRYKMPIGKVHDNLKKGEYDNLIEKGLIEKVNNIWNIKEPHKFYMYIHNKKPTSEFESLFKKLNDIDLNEENIELLKEFLKKYKKKNIKTKEKK